MPTITSAVEVERLTPAIGARVRGIDLGCPMSEAAAADLRSLLVQYKVLFFAGQELDPNAHVRLGRLFGTLTASHPVMAPLDAEHPEVWEIDSYTEVRNDQWHTDVTFVPRPPAIGVLRAVRVPRFGGDTLWADLESAYESLPADLARRIDGLWGVHDGSDEFAAMLAARGGVGNRWDGVAYQALQRVRHPVVRVHPETGRRSLFVNPGFTRRIDGLSEPESRELLATLFDHILRPEFQVRHRWSPGDVVIWDNRSTAHYATYDYGDFRRIMHRVTVRGDAPVGPASPERAVL